MEENARRHHKQQADDVFRPDLERREAGSFHVTFGKHACEHGENQQTRDARVQGNDPCRPDPRTPDQRCSQDGQALESTSRDPQLRRQVCIVSLKHAHPLVSQGVQEVEDPDKEIGDPDKQQERTIREIPLGRPIAPEEVASLVVYAALDCPPAMTGQTFHCNGATYWA